MAGALAANGPRASSRSPGRVTATLGRLDGLGAHACHMVPLVPSSSGYREPCLEMLIPLDHVVAPTFSTSSGCREIRHRASLHETQGRRVWYSLGEEQSPMMLGWAQPLSGPPSTSVGREVGEARWRITGRNPSRAAVPKWGNTVPHSRQHQETGLVGMAGWRGEAAPSVSWVVAREFAKRLTHRATPTPRERASPRCQRCCSGDPRSKGLPTQICLHWWRPKIY